MKKLAYPTDVSIITTYRCQMRCKMCDIWKNPSDRQKEITADDLKILPSFKFVNITGGEPFQRDDLEEIVELMFTKSPRIVISTSGWHYDRVIKLAKKFPNIGIRVSIEGLKETNDLLRGRAGGFDKGYSLLKELQGLSTDMHKLLKDSGPEMEGSLRSLHRSLKSTEELLELLKNKPSRILWGAPSTAEKEAASRKALENQGQEQPPPSAPPPPEP